MLKYLQRYSLRKKEISVCFITHRSYKTNKTSLLNVSLYSFKKEGTTSTDGVKALNWRHFECHPSSQRVGWGRQALHSICFSLRSNKSWCSAFERNARSKTYGASSPWVRYMPCKRGAFLPVFRWDHSSSDSQRAWAWSSSSQSARRN